MSQIKVILDATTLTTLMSCARLADFRFNHHYQPIEGNSPAIEMGQIVHTYLEYYYNKVIEGMKKDDAHAYALAAADVYISSGDVKNSESKDIQLARDTCQQYYEHYRNDSWTPLEVETVKGKVIYEDDEVAILWKAKFDLLVDTNKGIFPLDHKTMKQRRNTINLNNQFSGQCILAGTRTMFINKIGFQTSLKPAEKFTREAINFSFDRLLEWQSVIVPYWVKQMIMWNETGYFPPNYTHCESKYGQCAFKEVCEVDRNMRNDTLKQFFKVGEAWDI